MSNDNATPSPLDDLLKQADDCYANGDHNGAIEPLDQALRLTDRHPTILRALGTQLFLAGRHTWSRTIFEELSNAHPENVENHVHHAIASFHDGDSDSCAGALHKALALDPDHRDALKLMADLDVAEKRFEAAIPKYERIAEKHGITVDSLHALAYCQFKNGDIARAENTYEQLLEFNAQDDLAQDNLKAVRAEANCTVSESESQSETVEAKPSQNLAEDNAAELALEQADFFMQAGNQPAALEELKRAVHLDPSNPQLVEAYGALLFTSGEYDEARAQFRRLIEINPSDANAYTRLGMTCYELGKIDEFENSIGIAMEIEPENSGLLHFLGKINLDQEQFHDAGRIYSKLNELEPENIENLLALGKCLFMGDEKEAAVESFKRVLMLDPENGTAIANLQALGVTEWEAPNIEPTLDEENAETSLPIQQSAEDYILEIETKLENGEIPDALKLLTDGIQAYPENLHLLNALGNLHFQSGNAEGALIAFLKKVELKPEDSENHLQVATAAFVLEDYSLFENHLEHVLKLAPENPQALKLLASANFKSGKYAEAAKLYTQLIETSPEDIEIILALGVCFHHEEDMETARACFKRALELDPYNEIASDNLKALPPEQSVEPTTEITHSDTENGTQETVVGAVAIGNLFEAQELLAKGRHLDAWNCTLDAIGLRPFHPEAYLHLAEIALDANDEQQALVCLKRLSLLTPKWEVCTQALDSLKNKSNCTTSSTNWPALPPLKDKPSITACLIVKNEERFLDKCLQSLQGTADQIVVVDTGSTDRTVEIARTHNAEIHHFEWCDDFAAARNFSLEKARGDWVLILDADEVLTPEGRKELQIDTAAQNVIGYRIHCTHLEPAAEGGYQPMADAWHYVPRLVRNAPGIHFTGIIHEQLFSSAAVRADDWQMETSFGKTRIDHYGYAKEVKQSRNKNERNIQLLERALQDNPKEPTLLMSYALDLYNRGDIEMALEKNKEAFQLVSDYPEDGVSPEVRERLVSVFCNILLQSELYEELIEVAESQLAQNCGPTSSILFMYALALFKSGRVENALDPLRECIAQQNEQTYCAPFPGSTGAAPHHLLADCLVKQNQSSEALEQYRTALNLKPDHAGVRHDFARLLTQEGRPEEAIELLHEAIQLGTMNVTLWSLGSQIVNGHLTDADIALRWTDCAIQEDHKHPEIRKQRAIALLSAGQFKEALPFFEAPSSSDNPLNESARMICQLMTGESVALSYCDREKTISIAMANWCRRLIERGQESAVRKINDQLHHLDLILPTAAQVLREALPDVNN